jgi:hypothetical protein
MKKIISSIMIALVLCLTLVSAYTVTKDNTPADTSSYPMDNAVGRLFSSIGYSGTFSGYGDALKCTTYPTESKVFTKDSTLLKVVKFVFPTGTLIGVLTSSETVKVTAGADEAILINWFRGVPDDGYYADHPGDSRQYMGEIYLGYGGASSVKLTCDAKNYWNRLCYYEIYTCPKPCLADGDCFAGQSCDKTVLSQVTDITPTFFPTSAGACIIEAPTHKTQVYSCENGVKKNLGTVSYGNLNFCDDSSAAHYRVTSASGTVDQCLTYEPDACSIETEAELPDTSEINKTITVAQKGITLKEVNTVSSGILVNSVCSGDISCPEGSTCKGIDSFIADGDLTESKAKTIREDFCYDYVFHRGLGIMTEEQYKNTCGILGLGFTDFNKNRYFQNHFGFCILDSDKVNLEKITGWAAFFDITGDEGVDGLIIIFGGIVLIIILGNMAGGRSIGGRK